MSIYTRVGDEGRSQRIDGETIPKQDPRLAAGGTLDELCAHLGVCARLAFDSREHKKANKTKYGNLGRSLETIQRQLFAAGAMVAAAGTAVQPDTGDLLTDKTVEQMEAFIDTSWKELPELTGFLLPGGTLLASHLHVARCVCRRAERAMAEMHHTGQPVPPLVQRYVNRLSDLLFTLARLANQEAKEDEKLAHP